MFGAGEERRGGAVFSDTDPRHHADLAHGKHTISSYTYTKNGFKTTAYKTLIKESPKLYNSESI